MKTKEDVKRKGITLVIFVLLMFSLACLFFIAVNSSSPNELYLTILKADTDLSEISFDAQKAESYYVESCFAYEDEDY